MFSFRYSCSMSGLSNSHFSAKGTPAIASAETGRKLEAIPGKSLWAAENTRKDDASAKKQEVSKGS